MSSLLSEAETVDVTVVESSRINDLVRQAEEMATLALDRTMFGPEEVLNMCLDTRALLLEVQKILAEPALAG